MTIDKNLVDGSRTGPFLILDVEDETVQSIEDDEFLYVFLDGVLQRRGSKNSYTVSGPNIYFNVPIKDEMKIDMRYLYGRDVGQVIKLYDFSTDEYYARSIVTLEVTSGLNDLIEYQWTGQYRGLPIQAYQVRLDGSYNILGEISNSKVNGTEFSFQCFGFECELDTSLDVVFAIKGRYSLNTAVSISSYSIIYERDENGRIITESSNYWSGTFVKDSYKSPFVSLSNDDLIKIEGEEKFRRIKKLPRKVTTREQRLQQQVSNSMFGTVDVERYNGIAKGEGLSVIAYIENGSVVRLEWNQRSYEPVTQPTAYQYYTPPVLNFIPLNGEGGGAKATVIVSKGQVISVDLIEGGSGYTEAPKVEVSRRYDILTERDIGVSVINIGVNPYVEGAGMLSAQAIIDAGSQIFDYFHVIRTSISFDSVKIDDKTITTEVQLLNEAGNTLNADDLALQRTTYTPADEVQAFITSSEAVITAQIQDIISNTIVSTNRQFTSTVQNLIPNDALTNVNYYAVGAYLDIDLDSTDTIVYIADTSKFKYNGYLLIGDEVVFYYRKYNDRFLNVLRGQDGTTPKFWEAGTFIRQIPDLVKVAYGGISVIESGSHVVSVNASSGIRDTSVQRQIQSIQSQFITKVASTELVLSRPVTGIVDGYPSDIIFISDPIDVRNGPDVDLLDDYEIIQRNGNTLFALNSAVDNYILSSPYFIQGNVGHAIGNFDQFIYPGYADVSGITLLEVDTYFPTLTLNDLVVRKISSYTSLGEYFNLGNNSHQNSVAISNFSGIVSGTVNVQNTNYFPDFGYLFTSQGTIIQYTSKTNTSFEGCSVYRGSNTINTGDELVPYFID